jgi:hypothetical protein
MIGPACVIHIKLYLKPSIKKPLEGPKTNGRIILK